MRSIPLAVLLLFAGCATSESTLQQTRVWDAYAACKASGRVESNIQIERVEPTGRWWWRTGDGSYGKEQLESCMREELGKWVPAAATGAAASARPIQGDIVRPAWKVGDEWAYRYEGPSGRGTFVWSVDRIETMSAQPHYVIRTGNREILYRVSDFAFTEERVGGQVVRHDTPSEWRTVVFPLSVGMTWDMKYHEARPADRQTEDVERTCQAEAEETTTVPGGAFTTIRVVCKNKLTGAWVLTSWYAPEARQAVRLELAATGGRQIRELLTLKLR